jgi:hypothetical protein
MVIDDAWEFVGSYMGFFASLWEFVSFCLPERPL